MRVTIQRKRHRKITTPVAEPSRVAVGFPRSAVAGSVIERAVYNEFGTRNIPERPFMRNAMRSNREKYRRMMKGAAKDILANRDTVQRVLSRLGILAVADIQHEIGRTGPANAPSTIKKKGSSVPLIDTGEMRQAVTWQILRR